VFRLPYGDKKFLFLAHTLLSLFFFRHEIFSLSSLTVVNMGLRDIKEGRAMERAGGHIPINWCSFFVVFLSFFPWCVSLFVWCVCVCLCLCVVGICIVCFFWWMDAKSSYRGSFTFSAGGHGRRREITLLSSCFWISLKNVLGKLLD